MVMSPLCATVSQLDNDQLLVCLKALVGRDRKNLVDLLVHLGEVDQRKLHLQAAKPSLFAYCRDELRMSEPTASKRIGAARLARRYPILLDLIGTGDLHLSGLSVLSSYLTDDNHRDLLDAARGRSKRAIERMVARRFPRPDQRPMVRKLSAPDSFEMAGAPDADPAAQQSPEGADNRRGRAVKGGLLPAKAEVGSRHGGSLSPPSGHAGAESPSGSSKSLSTRSSSQPTAVDRYRLHLTVSASVHDKLEEARDLLSHTVPDGDLSAILDRALTLLIEQTKKKRFAVGHGTRPRAQPARPSRPEPEPEPGPGPGPEPETRPACEAVSPGPAGHESKSPQRASHEPEPPGRKRSRAIPAEVRRTVWVRDEGRCTYRSESGERCTATRKLEFHHEKPFAMGGSHDASGICLLCKAHNLLVAEVDFGAAKMEDSIRKKRERDLRSPANVNRSLAP